MGLVRLLFVVACLAVTSGSAIAQPAPPPPSNVVGCTLPGVPVFVFTENLTPARGDLCASFQRATRRISFATVPAGQVTLRLRLDDIEHRDNDVACKIHVDAYSQTGTIAMMSGGASVQIPAEPVGVRRLATRDCIDAVVESVIQKFAPTVAPALKRTYPLPPPLTAPPPPPAPSTP